MQNNHFSLNGHLNENNGRNLYTIVIYSVIVNKTLRARTHSPYKIVIINKEVFPIKTTAILRTIINNSNYI